MDGKAYLQDRLDDQIKWYEVKSQHNQRWYKYLRIVEITAAASIPFLAAYMAEISSIRAIVGILGILVTVVAGVVTLYRFQELWIEYRTTAEGLKHEKHLFLTKTTPYDTDEPLPLLVERIEGLISKQHTVWTRHMKGVQTTGNRGSQVGPHSSGQE